MKQKSKNSSSSYRKSLSLGRKGLRGESIYGYDQVMQISITLSPAVISELDNVAEKADLSKSEWLERLLREHLGLPQLKHKR